MIKKFLIFFFVFSFVFSVPISAEIVEEVLYSYTGQNLYNDILSNPSNISNLELVDDTCYYYNSANAYKTFSYYDTLRNLTGNGTYHFVCNGSNIQIRFRIQNVVNGVSQGYIQKSYNAPFELDLEHVLGFYVVITGYTEGSLTFFEALSVSVIPDEPSSSGVAGDSSDFGNFIMPLVSSLSTQTWEVFSNCWWALAFVLLPLVYLVIVIVINLFRFVNIKFSSKYKFRFFSKFRDNLNYNYKPFKFTFKNFGFGKNKIKPSYNRYVYIDGVRYYAPNYKKMQNLKNSFNKKTDYSDKKYDIVDIDVD